MSNYDYDRLIRKVPNFPKPGILFYDITLLIAHPEGFGQVQRDLDALFPVSSYDALLAVESRGFLFAAVAGFRHRKPVYLARKPGKLPNPTLKRAYTLEYGNASLEVQELDLAQGGRWLVVDDLIATGGTLEAACALLEAKGVEVAGIFSVIGLPFLGFPERLKKYNPRTLLDYHGE